MCVTTLAEYTAYLVLRCFHAEAYLGASISVSCATDSSIWLPKFYVTHTPLSNRLGCKIQEAQLLLCSSRRSETCGTEENGHQQSFAVRGLCIVWLPSTREYLFGFNASGHCLVRVRMLHYVRVGLRITITQSHMHAMQQTHTHKAVTRRVEAKKLLSRRRQSE